jgi:hypothetical protein
MKKIVVVYGGVDERVGFVKSVRQMNLPSGVNNVKTYFDDGERFDLSDMDELSYFAGIVNLAMQRNPSLIILHEIKNRNTLTRLTDLFDVELYTLLVSSGNQLSNKHDFVIGDCKSDDFSIRVEELIDKLL